MDPKDSRLRFIIGASLFLIVFPLAKKVQIIEQGVKEFVDLETKALLSEIFFIGLLI